MGTIDGGSHEEPKPINEILEHIEQVIDAEQDDERAADAEVSRLEHDHGELVDTREGMINANQAGQAEHDVTDINKATLEAKIELSEARQKSKNRHPSTNPPK